MKISAVFATFNEIQAVKKAWPAAYDPAVDEWLLADNGSTDGVDDYVRDLLKPELFVKFKKNTGIAVSHNILFAQASGDLVILSGCNRVPPQDWVQIFKDHFEAFPNLVAACIYNEGVEESQRILGPLHVHASKKTHQIREGVLMDCIAWKREVFREIGYYDLGFGFYGCEDLEFSARVHRYCQENKNIAGFIPGLRNKHFGFDPRTPHDPSTASKNYYDLKKMEVESFPEKEKRFYELKSKNFPYFSPY